MSETVWLAVGGVLLSGLSAWFAAWFAGRSTVKVKQIDVEAAAYANANKINSDLFENLRQQIVDLKGELEDRDKRMDKIEEQLQEVRGHNNALISFCYRLIAIIRKGGNETDIPNPPHGIYL